jgi:hypothetical protein
MRNRVVIGLVLFICSASASGWGSQVHRDLTALALAGLDPALPAWLRSPETLAAAQFQSNQPDRWRGWPSVVLKHENDPEHYLDLELLAPFGLTLETLPRLRGEYIQKLTLARAAQPEIGAGWDAAKDPARTQEWPGFVVYAVAEHYARLQAAFNQVRILEQLGDPARAPQLAQARAIAIYHLGDLSHYVADIAQPLHTTKHFNGWVGENPQGYKWRERFHAYIDESVAARHGLNFDTLRPHVRYGAPVNSQDPWDDVLRYFGRSFTQMEPLYALERDGQLDGPPGAALIRERLIDAAGMISALVSAAWESSTPTPEQIATWTRYDRPAAATTSPAATSQP